MAKKKVSEKTEKTGVDGLDSDKIEELFLQSFLNNMKSYKDKIDMDEFECLVDNDMSSGKVVVTVKVYGLAGTIAKRLVHDKKTGFVHDAFKTVMVNGKKFKLTDSWDLNTNDYALIYSA